MQAARREMGLDAPMPLRYLRFCSAILLRGDLGCSLLSGRPVTGVIAGRLGNTVTLALAATALALCLGGALGVAAASRPGSRLDVALMGLASLGLAVPGFWLAMLLVLVFSLRLRWLPVMGAGTTAHLVLPALTLSLPLAAVVARLLRSSLLDVQGADYVRTARGKGLPEARVLRDHLLRNSLIPLVTLLGLHLGHLLGGAFVVETVFAYPGLGSLIVQATFERDYPIVVAAALLIAVIFQGLNLAVDLAHGWLDPRVVT
jgi:ABC-type dipeptide/oligopeptide/nickel transport system permease component